VHTYDEEVDRMKMGALALALAVLAVTAGAFALTARNGSHAEPRGVVTTTDSSVLEKVTRPILGNGGNTADDEAGDNERDNEADDQAGDDRSADD
jgi:hypothetical protein